jgi:hypothetical protein
LDEDYCLFRKAEGIFPFSSDVKSYCSLDPLWWLESSGQKRLSENGTSICPSKILA